jgi:hypothetical protein
VCTLLRVASGNCLDNFEKVSVLTTGDIYKVVICDWRCACVTNVLRGLVNS